MRLFRKDILILVDITPFRTMKGLYDGLVSSMKP
jgi:hypothetical protein